VLVFHGGGWDGGDPSQLAHFNRWLADRGFSVASATYRLAPRWTWPAPRDDARKALAWLKAHADELGFDASRIVVLGRSAGGQIAQTLAYSRPAPSIRGLVLLYSPSDMIFGYTHGSDDNVLPSRTLIKQYLGTDDVNSEPFRTSAGHLMVSESSPPTLIAHGTRDEIVAIGHSITLARALEEKRVPHYFLRFPLATHGFDYNLDGPSAQVFLRALARFLASTLA
jgi:acetyl esterase/lipase